MEIFDWKYEINDIELDKVKNELQNHGIIVFPTETVYGIGANAFDEIAVKKIYEAKKRPADNPLIVHVSDKEMLYSLVGHVSEVEQKLIDHFMPGPFTLILEKNSDIPDIVTAGLDTVAIRMPSHEIANRIIKKCHFPIAAPSANESGKPSGTNIQDIVDELSDNIKIFIDGGVSNIGLESTVVKVVDDIPIILRPGKITYDDIEKLIGRVKISEKILNKVQENEIVESPGMKHKHYSPNTECVLIDIEDESKRLQKISELLSKYQAVVIGFEEDQEKINTDKFISFGRRDDLDTVSKNLYSALRRADKMGCELIIIEATVKTGLGLAIMNRILRACGFKMIL